MPAALDIDMGALHTVLQPPPHSIKVEWAKAELSRPAMAYDFRFEASLYSDVKRRRRETAEESERRVLRALEAKARHRVLQEEAGEGMPLVDTVETFYNEVWRVCRARGEQLAHAQREVTHEETSGRTAVEEEELAACTYLVYMHRALAQQVQAERAAIAEKQRQHAEAVRLYQLQQAHEQELLLRTQREAALRYQAQQEAAQQAEAQRQLRDEEARELAAEQHRLERELLLWQQIEAEKQESKRLESQARRITENEVFDQTLAFPSQAHYTLFQSLAAPHGPHDKRLVKFALDVFGADPDIAHWLASVQHIRQAFPALGGGGATQMLLLTCLLLLSPSVDVAMDICGTSPTADDLQLIEASMLASRPDNIQLAYRAAVRQLREGVFSADAAEMVYPVLSPPVPAPCSAAASCPTTPRGRAPSQCDSVRTRSVSPPPPGVLSSGGSPAVAPRGVSPPPPAALAPNPHEAVAMEQLRAELAREEQRLMAQQQAEAAAERERQQAALRAQEQLLEQQLAAREAALQARRQQEEKEQLERDLREAQELRAKEEQLEQLLLQKELADLQEAQQREQQRKRDAEEQRLREQEAEAARLQEQLALQAKMAEEERQLAALMEQQRLREEQKKREDEERMVALQAQLLREEEALAAQQQEAERQALAQQLAQLQQQQRLEEELAARQRALADQQRRQHEIQAQLRAQQEQLFAQHNQMQGTASPPPAGTHSPQRPDLSSLQGVSRQDMELALKLLEANQTLVGMGFGDVDLNERLLGQKGGDVEAVVEELLKMDQRQQQQQQEMQTKETLFQKIEAQRRQLDAVKRQTQPQPQPQPQHFQHSQQQQLHQQHAAPAYGVYTAAAQPLAPQQPQLPQQPHYQHQQQYQQYQQPHVQQQLPFPVAQQQQQQQQQHPPPPPPPQQQQPPPPPGGSLDFLSFQ